MTEALQVPYERRFGTLTPIIAAFKGAATLEHELHALADLTDDARGRQ